MSYFVRFVEGGGRSVRSRIALLAVLALACSGCWAQFRGDAGHSGSQPFEFGVGRNNVAGLAPAWTAQPGGMNLSAPVVAGGTVMIGSDDHKLYAFDAAGSKNCVLSECQPLWTATAAKAVASTPAIANGTVFVASADMKIYAFSADGTKNCAGTPTVCSPLWTAPVNSTIGGPVAVANGVVFVTSQLGKLFAFDAAGITNCTGTPLVCKPLWSSAAGPILSLAPAIANAVVYAVTSGGTLYAYDAAGTTGCAGIATRVCQPLWSAPGAGVATESPAVAGGNVYVAGGAGGLRAVDAAGVVNCSGSPKTCAPRWTSAAPSYRAPAIANGVVFGDASGTLAAFDAQGVTNCSGTPVVCSPMWSAAPDTFIASTPSVANGVVYALQGGALSAYDTSGTTNCGGTPTVCTPLWSASSMASGSPAIVSGAIYTVSDQQGLQVYRSCSNPVSGIGYAPCELTNAYQLPSFIGGKNMTVAIVDANHDPNAEQDLAVYRKTFGLPPCTINNMCFRQVNQLGQNSNYPPADPGWALEISLDLDMVSAACPRCNILLVEAPNSLSAIGTAEDTAVALGANVVSNSFGANETVNLGLNDSHFTHPGVPIVASSGDGGYAGGPQYPAVVPGVTSVGGTFLDRATTPRGWTESVWADGVNTNESGSGCALYQPKPSWQTDTGCTNRTVADVSAIASNLAVYDTYGGPPGWITVGGTSASAPLVAGIYALARGTVGVADLYANTAFLHDVTTGTNGTCNSSYLCTAVAGYDGPTGLGTPCGTRAFGTAYLSPSDCNAQPAGAPLRPSARQSRPAAIVPSCATAPTGGVRCLSYRQR